AFERALGLGQPRIVEEEGLVGKPHGTAGLERPEVLRIEHPLERQLGGGGRRAERQEEGGEGEGSKDCFKGEHAWYLIGNPGGLLQRRRAVRVSGTWTGTVRVRGGQSHRRIHARRGNEPDGVRLRLADRCNRDGQRRRADPAPPGEPALLAVSREAHGAGHLRRALWGGVESGLRLCGLPRATPR